MHIAHSIIFCRLPSSSVIIIIWWWTCAVSRQWACRWNRTRWSILSVTVC